MSCKLNRTLAQDLDTVPAAVAIVRSTVTLAHDPGRSLMA